MKKIATLTLALLLLLIGKYDSEITNNSTTCTSLNGPSSVAALNTHFDNQDHLNEVFEKWLNNFEHNPNTCEKILSNINDVRYPNLYVPTIISVELEVLNECENEIYTHFASFELVVIEEDLRA